MSLRYANSCLSLFVAGSAIGILSLVSWAVLWPCATGVAETPPPSGPKAVRSTRDEPEEATLARFETLWNRPLRQQLYDPPPKPEPSAPVVRRPPPQLELLGTIVEPGRSVAIVRVGQSNPEMKKVGDSLGPNGSGIKLESVQPNSIVLSRAGERIPITLPEKKRTPQPYRY